MALKIAKTRPGRTGSTLPSVGLTTIRNLVEGGYAALAVQAGKTLFFDREASLTLADKHKLAIVALPDDFA